VNEVETSFFLTANIGELFMSN